MARTPQQNASSETDRIALVDQLWKLKKHWQEHTGAHVPLNVLIKEVDYRRDVLEGAERSGKPELEDLVRRIRNIEERLGEISSITAPPASREKFVRAGLALAAIVILAFTLLLIGAGRLSGTGSALPAADPEVAFRLHGSNTIGESLAPALLKAFYAARDAADVLLVAGDNAVEKQVQALVPGVDRVQAVDVHAHGSSTAFCDLAAGAADLGMSSRAIKPEEIAALAPRYGDLSAPGSEHVIALDGLAVIVNAANPLTALSKAEVAAVFSGAIRNWQELGGPNAPINIYARDDKSGTFDTFKSLVLEANGVRLAESAQRFESSSELADRVAADPNGIGFIGLPYVRNARALAIAEAAGTPAVVPTEFTVSTEDYPLSRRLYFYMPGNTANTAIREFVDFSLSADGQRVVEATGLVSQRVRVEPVRPRDDAPPRFRELTRDARRLSVTFRFQPDGAGLDNKGVRDLERLVEFMEGHRERELVLLGFVPATGNPDAELALSRAQARRLEQKLSARGVYAAAGLGSALPVGTSETPSGRLRNRRVEVWMR